MLHNDTYQRLTIITLSQISAITPGIRATQRYLPETDYHRTRSNLRGRERHHTLYPCYTMTLTKDWLSSLSVKSPGKRTPSHPVSVLHNATYQRLTIIALGQISGQNNARTPGIRATQCYLPGTDYHHTQSNLRGRERHHILYRCYTMILTKD